MRHEDEFLKLANGLPDVPQGKFIMSVWAVRSIDVPFEGLDCGFAGCAIGWMIKLVPENQLIEGSHGPRTTGYIRTYTGFAAVAKYFGISVRDAKYLFAPQCYRDVTKPLYLVEAREISPAEVSERMLDYLESKKAGR